LNDLFIVKEEKIQIPEDVNITVKDKIVEISGQKGIIKEDFSHAPIELKLEKKHLTVFTSLQKKREQALVGTIASLINNMILGVTKGFTYKLKIVYAHFPTSLKVDKAKNKIIIENFIGEKASRTAQIMGDVEIDVSGDEVIVQGIRLQDVSQTAANIENATKVKHKDLRVFLDGIYVYDKKGEIM
jgi:large subunit ribosomal protein L6